MEQPAWTIPLQPLGARSDKAEGAAWREALVVFAPAAAAFVFCLANPFFYADGDTNTHLATGQWILAHHAVPAVDPFSYTMAGHAWVAHEWLAEALMASAWAALGWNGLRLLIGAFAGAAFALLAAEQRRSLRPLSLIASLSMSFIILAKHLLARPHVIALPLLALWTIAILSARRERRAPRLWCAPAMTLWANLHGSFVVGLGLAAAFAVEALLEAPRWRTLLGWGGFLAAATGCALINPHGAAYLLYPFKVTSMRELTAIGEWRPIDLLHWSTFSFALLLGLSVCLLRGVRIPPVRLAMLLGLVFLSLQHAREEIVLAVLGPLLLAEPLGRALEPGEPARALRRFGVGTGAAVAAAFVLVSLVRLATPDHRGDSATAPESAVAATPASLRARPVFNEYSFGGWLMLDGVRPFIDGRADMYGDAHLRLYTQVAAAQPKAVADTFQRFGIVWTILPPTSPLVGMLDRTPGWRRLYADKWAVVQTRDPVEPTP
ncbi:MAG TPA: hypothetical protein VGF50_00875 [Caulobacteraceae bacterium]